MKRLTADQLLDELADRLAMRIVERLKSYDDEAETNRMVDELLAKHGYVAVRPGDPGWAEEAGERMKQEREAELAAARAKRAARRRKGKER